MQHKQVTQTQIEHWLKDPVTLVLGKCLDWYTKDIQDEINTGACVDQSNADLTLSRISQRTGQIEALRTSGNFEEIFNRYKMVGENNA